MNFIQTIKEQTKLIIDNEKTRPWLYSVMGLIGLIIVKKIFQGDKLTGSKQEYLEDVLTSHKMDNIQDLLNKYKDKRDEVRELIELHYKDIYNPINSGSYAKHTAINCKFDLDIVVPFKKKSFNTLSDMFNDIYDFLYKEYSSTATVRKQNVSIGIQFFPDEDGDEIEITLTLNFDSEHNDSDDLYFWSTRGEPYDKFKEGVCANDLIITVKKILSDKKLINKIIDFSKIQAIGSITSNGETTEDYDNFMDNENEHNLTIWEPLENYGYNWLSEQCEAEFNNQMRFAKTILDLGNC